MKARCFSWQGHLTHLKNLSEQAAPSLEELVRASTFLSSSSLPPKQFPNLLTVLGQLKAKHDFSNDLLYNAKVKPILSESYARKAWSLDELSKILMGMVQTGYSEDSPVLSELFTECISKAKTGMNTQLVRDLLWVMTETQFVSYELVAEIEDMFERATFAPGLFDQNTTATVLNAYAQLRLDFTRLEPVVVAGVLMNKFQDFEANYKVRVAYEMARMEYWDAETWGVMLRHLHMEDYSSLTRHTKFQAYHMLMILDLLAPSDIRGQTEALQLLRKEVEAVWEEEMHKKGALTRFFSKPTLLNRKLGIAVSRPVHPVSEKTSLLTKKFAQHIANMGKAFIIEHVTPAPYSLDVDILYEARTVIELNGPTHYIRESFRPTGSTILKRKILQKLNYVVVEVPHYVWDKLSEKQRISQINRLLRVASANEQKQSTETLVP
mmetsp:Transcript_3596/g.7732  ORF Transcript_3596/g.7732 Transcript_3596/m.7732 type:complete len:437 (+) Transcript_3596:1156-2466(+)|eukprot:CAMPEP_0204905678 /NCGR_PEP_ID=MMETSP1397-20131031/5553_1 /ASSEMBLY_ACC=CAM_ASM_000891 /TAXON_ID=49980 /ORGANISM="Climacostomum Climacostomum virens, Strain Stock W-24" /LENGTH=436 /DNA_ID=CAMNT_0052074585 /DNA_START=1137 /DNA_END=2447 /DNA_ORIENTATION=+